MVKPVSRALYDRILGNVQRKYFGDAYLFLLGQHKQITTDSPLDLIT